MNARRRAGADAQVMDDNARPFVGSEAVVNGKLTKSLLRQRYRAVFPDVYLPKGVVPTLAQRTVAAWLWSHREGIVAGAAAAAWHGAKWVDDGVAIELIWPNARTPQGLQTTDARLRSDEFQTLRGIRVTSVPRTAFDIGRQRPSGKVIARLDALAAATGVTADDVNAVARHHRGARGIRQLGPILGMVDAGAQSPKETWLRLLLVDAGFPRPVTQIPVPWPDGSPRYFLDMGWPEAMVAVEYDGEQHRLDPIEYRNDIIRSEYIESLGWRRVRVIAGDRSAGIVPRVRRAWDRRDC